jgi:serine/threonine protein kinase
MSNTQIGCGGYGAVFHPPIGSNDTSMVGKVVFTESFKEAKKEWFNVKTIRKIDPDQNYFLYPTTKEEIDISEYNKYAKTPIANAIDGKLVQFTLKNGGVSLRKHHYPSLNQLLVHIIRVAQSIQIMLQNNIVHLDIHLGNMMLNGEGNCKVIDFGLSKNSKTFYSQLNYLWSAQYAVNPPEFRLIQTKHKKKYNLVAEQDLLAKYLVVDESDLNHVYTNPAFIQSYNELNTSLVNIRNSEQYSKKIALRYLESMNSHQTTDVYGLGVAMIEVLIKTDFPEVSVNIYMKLWDIITKMIMPHPEHRMRIETVISEMKGLLKQIENIE